MRSKTFPTTAHKEFIFKLVKWVYFVDTKIHKIKIPRFTGKQFQYIIRFIERPVDLSKMKEASEIAGKRMTNKHALKFFGKLVHRAAIILSKLNI